MSAEFLAVQVLNGLQYGMLLLLVTSGLALIFGIMGIVNFAHGALYALGAYFGVVVIAWTGSFWLALAFAPILVAVLGASVERTVIRRLRSRPPVDTLLLTFGLALCLEQVARVLWGPGSHVIPTPASLSGTIAIFGGYPLYRLFIIGFGILVAFGLLAFLQFTRLGLIIRAASVDAEMVASLGINIQLIFTLVFALGAGLAALGGVVVGPLVSAYPGMGIDVIVDAFVVLVIGGLGSFWGAILAALLIGQVVTMGNAFLPDAALVVVFALMVAVLLWKPRGIIGQGKV